MFNNENNIFNIASDTEFLELSLSIFNFQVNQNPIYGKWVKLLNIDSEKVTTLQQIPFLPIEFFKEFEIVSSAIHSKTIKFTSSATTSLTPATHFVNDILIYEKSFLKCLVFN